MGHPYPITDWDDAYANSAHIEGADAFPPRWAAKAARFRDGLAHDRVALDVPYGEHERQKFDLFLPDAEPQGLVVFVHGGYWKAFDRKDWSHLAAGALARRHAVALPSYRLAPQARISDIIEDVANAIGEIAARTPGQIRLAGHSAGGHLVTRMICADSPLARPVLGRIVNTVSISGLHDLRPLLATGMNAILRLDEAEAMRQSPALLRPAPEKRVVAWVGAGERPEFVRQNRLIGLLWDGFGIETSVHEEAGRHHFDVIDGLEDLDHPLMTALIGLP